MFDITLILNAKIPSTTFSNIVSTVINNFSAKKGNDNRNTAIRTDCLIKLFEILTPNKTVPESSVAECVNTVKAAIAAEFQRRLKEKQRAYIYLQEAVQTLESAGLEPKRLTKTDNKEVKTVAMIGEARQYYRSERGWKGHRTLEGSTDSVMGRIVKLMATHSTGSAGKEKVRT